NRLSTRNPTLSVASRTNKQSIKALRRSQRRVPVCWSAKTCLPPGAAPVTQAAHRSRISPQRGISRATLRYAERQYRTDDQERAKDGRIGTLARCSGHANGNPKDYGQRKKAERHPSELGAPWADQKHRNHSAKDRQRQCDGQSNHHDDAWEKRDATINRLQRHHRECDRGEPSGRTEGDHHAQPRGPCASL